MALLMNRPLRLGTRGSQLALWQANWITKKLRALGANVEIIQIATHGDINQVGPIGSATNQGVFTNQIQAALLAQKIDFAVHSLKDLPTETISGLKLAAVPLREGVRDALISKNAISFQDLPSAAHVGTGSIRRQAQLKYLRPDLRVMLIRGNVDTRLRKLEEEGFDAILLAEAGLKRLGFEDKITECFSVAQMLPAIGQGALGIECRAADHETSDWLAKLSHTPSFLAVTAERSLLEKLHAGCSAPVGAWARFETSEHETSEHETLKLSAAVLSADGTQRLSAQGEIKLTKQEAFSAAAQLGETLAEQLLEQGAKRLILEAREGQ